jgi:hypothetical protein
MMGDQVEERMTAGLDKWQVAEFATGSGSGGLASREATPGRFADILTLNYR